MSKIHMLSMHGKSEEVCRWVIHNYASNPMYADNITVQDWCDASREWLDLLEEDRLWDEAVEFKFRDSVQWK
jgi:hypothetical protein